MQPEDPPEDPNVPGPHDWTGVLGAGANGLRLRLRAPNGFEGPVTLYSLDQGNAAIPATAKQSGDRVTLDVPAVRGRFEGVLAGERLEGTWTQGRPMPLIFVKGDGGLARAQASALTQDALVALRTQAGSPALGAAAQKVGRGAALMADGLRAADRDVKATTQDRWHIGSITKSMTATLVARLVEAGAVRWDETVGGVLGAAIPDMKPAYRDATFLHLMSHHAGLEANIPAFSLLAFRTKTDPLPAQRIAYAQQALKRAPAAALGGQPIYSNSGFIIAGAMLEVKTGKAWEDLLRAHVFEPLGMVGAGFGAPGTPGAVDEPLGHSKAFFGDKRIAHPVGGSTITDNPPVLGPAGTVHARNADMLAYLAAHRDRPASFLSAASWDRLHTPPFGGTGALGWVVRPDGLWHNGSNTLWYAEAMIDRQQSAVAFAAANDGVIEKAEAAVSAALAGALAAA